MPTSKKANSKKNASLSARAKVISKKTIASSSKKNKTILYAVIIVVLLALLAIVMVQRKNSEVRQMVGIEEFRALNDRLNIDVTIPENASNVTYAVKGDSIGIVEYDKTVASGAVIHYILSYSKNANDKLEYFKGESWSTPIEMYVNTYDGKRVLVTSNVSSEDRKRMQGKWTDNSVFYVMATNTLTAREDFLQEVNRLVINNHKQEVE